MSIRDLMAPVNVSGEVVEEESGRSAADSCQDGQPNKLTPEART